MTQQSSLHTPQKWGQEGGHRASLASQRKTCSSSGMGTPVSARRRRARGLGAFLKDGVLNGTKQTVGVVIGGQPDGARELGNRAGLSLSPGSAPDSSNSGGTSKRPTFPQLLVLRRLPGGLAGSRDKITRGNATHRAWHTGTLGHSKAIRNAIFHPCFFGDSVEDTT